MSNEKTPATPASDFTLVYHGSLYTLKPNNDTAREHITANVSDETQWWAGAVVVEHRYVDDLIDKLQDAGYTVGT